MPSLLRHIFVRRFLLASLALFALSATAAERTIYYVPDALGSPVAAMDAQGNVLWRETYAPYGARITRATDNSARNAYTGKPEDRDTGLVYMGARWYDPVAARFTGIDPQGFAEGNPQSFGRYVYANNAPYRYVDPNGELPVDALFLAYDAARFATAVYSGNSVAMWDSGADLAASFLGVLSPVPFTGQAIKAARAADKAANDGATEIVQRWMSHAELKKTESSGLLRGGREGTHYVTDAANSDPLRARERLALPKTPEVRVTLEVPGGVFSSPSRVKPDFNMPGGGMERTATGNIPVKILKADRRND